MAKIEILGAREHNLQNVDIDIPRNQLVVFTGLSGSGKSSLAFDTIHAEGQRRYMETFSAYARHFIGNIERPDLDSINGLSPVISIEQKTTNKNPRSTVGTVTEIYDFVRLLYARIGEAYSHISGERMVKYTEEQILALINEKYAGKDIMVLAPLVKARKGHYRELFAQVAKKEFLRVNFLTCQRGYRKLKEQEFTLIFLASLRADSPSASPANTHFLIMVSRTPYRARSSSNCCPLILVICISFSLIVISSPKYIPMTFPVI